MGQEILVSIAARFRNDLVRGLREDPWFRKMDGLEVVLRCLSNRFSAVRFSRIDASLAAVRMLLVSGACQTCFDSRQIEKRQQTIEIFL